VAVAAPVKSSAVITPVKTIETEKKNSTVTTVSPPLALSSTIKPTFAAAKPIIVVNQDKQVVQMNHTSSKEVLPVAKFTTAQKSGNGNEKPKQQEQQSMS
jgi:hypothetical protein